MRIDKSDLRELVERRPYTKERILNDDVYCYHEKEYIDSKGNAAARKFAGKITFGEL